MKLENRNIYLILGIVVVSLLSYPLALRNTLVIKAEYLMNRDRMETMTGFPSNLATMQKKEKELRSQLSQLGGASLSFQTDLLSVLNREGAKNGVNIANLMAPHKIVLQKDTVETYIFDLEGGYSNILKTLNALEKKKGYGVINHLAFEKKREYRSRRTFLQARVFLKQLR